MLFHTLRQPRLKLTALFGMAAALGLGNILPPETAQQRELRQLAADYGPLMSPARRQAFERLLTQNRDTAAGQQAAFSAGLCAHGAGGGTAAAGAGIAACPLRRRQKIRGDLSHLLAMHHWL